MSAGRVLAVATGLGAVAAGALIFWLWGWLGLPETGLPGDVPVAGLWRWFFAIWLPALFPAFTALHAMLRVPGGPEASPAARVSARWDRWSYALLPVFLLWMIAWRHDPDWRLALGAFFVGVLLAKVLLVVVTLYLGLALGDETRGEATGLGSALFVVALALYACLAPYVITAVSTAGDEHVYLLNTHSLYADGDVDIRNNVARGDWRPFYWGRPIQWNVSFVGFPALLLPGYALGKTLLPDYPLAGRLGATWTIGLFAALLGWGVFGLCRDVGASRPAAFWAWVVVALTPPVLVSAGHIYPELPAAAATVIGARAVLRIPARTWPALAAVGATAVFLVLLKERYAPLGFGLGIWALTRLGARRRNLGALLLVGSGAAVLAVAHWGPAARLFPRLTDPAYLGEVLLDWNVYMPRAFLGLLADQEFGLLYYAPFWALAIPGLLLLWRRRRETTLALAGTVLLYLLVLAKYQWIQWDAGWTPPPRFVLAAMPLLSPFVAEAFDRTRGGLLASANTLWLAWCATVGTVLCLVPFWRYNNLDGRTTLLHVTGAWLGLDLARFLPSLRAPTGWTWTALALGTALLVAVTAYWVRRREAPAPGWGVGSVVLAPLGAAGVVAGVAVGWLAAAALVPTWSIEAEAMQHSTGVPFGSYQTQDVLWVLKRDGEIWEQIVTWPGVTEIALVAGGYTATGQAPRMTLLLDEREVATWRLAAGQGEWRREEYVARVPTGWGRPVLRVRFDGLQDDPRGERREHAYLDRIRLRRVAGCRRRRPGGDRAGPTACRARAGRRGRGVGVGIGPAAAQ